MKNSNKLKTLVVFFSGMAIYALGSMGADFLHNNHYQHPIVIDIRPMWVSNVVSPIPTKPDPTRVLISPSPTVTPKPKKKVQIVPEAYAAEATTPNLPQIYPYENKVAFMDAGQKEVMAQVEQKLGKAYAELVFRESGFHPLSVNSSSGACGLSQALPCSKMACELTDVDCQLNWIKSYVERRYTNIDNALLFHDRKGWY